MQVVDSLVSVGCARQNVRNKPEDFYQSSVFKTVMSAADAGEELRAADVPFDVLVTNPPYSDDHVPK